MGTVTAGEKPAEPSKLSAQEELELDELRRSQPGLWIKDVSGTHVVMRGRLALAPEEPGETRGYVVELHLPRPSRVVLPEVFECGGLVPRITDRHVHAATGACCIELPVEYLLRPRQPFAEYVGGQVRSYFIAQAYYDEFQRWPHGERGHGGDGIREFCAEHFGKADLGLIARGLALLGRHAVKSRPCACGSGRKFLNCHFRLFRKAATWPVSARAELIRSIQLYTSVARPT